MSLCLERRPDPEHPRILVGEFVIPDLLGGSETLMIGKTLWAEFFNNRDWPVSSAVAVVLLIILVVPIVIFQNQQKKA